MAISRVSLASFSPCGHTLTYGRQMANACSEALALGKFQEINITPHSSGSNDHTFAEDDLVILCAPVYGGRIPAPALERIRTMKAQNTPVILLACYGNRHYDDALREFVDTAVGQGFRPLGAAACVAQHTLAAECAAGRPNELDLDSARDFATEVAAMLSSGAIPPDAVLSVPGNSPYREYKPFPLPQTVNDNCILCGQCWQNCPTAAIATGAPSEVDKERCIACMGCVTICPVGARIPSEAFLQKISDKLAPVCAVPRQNGYFSI